MSTKPIQAMLDSLNIIWTVTSKDIIDALKNRVVVSMIVMLSIILLVPKALPYIFEQSQTILPVYDMSDSSWIVNLKKSPELSVQSVHSLQELRLAVCNAIYPEIGLVIPVGFKQVIGEGERIDIQGYGCWAKRYQVSELQPKLEDILSQSLGAPVNLVVEGNIFYPPTEGVLYLGLATINSIVLILMIGIFTVPSLLIEEKETKTMQALLISPASISQVVVGKALAGSFYILVSSILIFIISWTDVIHWEPVILFVVGSGIFSVAVGLLLGGFFDKSQDMVGWMTALLLILTGAALTKALGIALPPVLSRILTWVPSVAIAEIYRAALSETYSSFSIWSSFGIVIVISILVYGVVIVRLRRFDR